MGFNSGFKGLTLKHEGARVLQNITNYSLDITVSHPRIF